MDIKNILDLYRNKENKNIEKTITKQKEKELYFLKKLNFKEEEKIKRMEVDSKNDFLKKYDLLDKLRTKPDGKQYKNKYNEKKYSSSVLINLFFLLLEKRRTDAGFIRLEKKNELFNYDYFLKSEEYNKIKRRNRLTPIEEKEIKKIKEVKKDNIAVLIALNYECFLKKIKEVKKDIAEEEDFKHDKKVMFSLVIEDTLKKIYKFKIEKGIYSKEEKYIFSFFEKYKLTESQVEEFKKKKVKEDDRGRKTNEAEVSRNLILISYFVLLYRENRMAESILFHKLIKGDLKIDFFNHSFLEGRSNIERYIEMNSYFQTIKNKSFVYVVETFLGCYNRKSHTKISEYKKINYLVSEIIQYIIENNKENEMNLYKNEIIDFTLDLIMEEARNENS